MTPPAEPTGPMLIDGHQFGHHPDDRDPWDALYLDVKWLDPADAGPILALITFWKGEARKRAEAAGSLSVERVAVLERALREAQAVVDDGWCTPTYHAGPCRDISAALGDSA